jgi:Protein of unknown function (DUF3016)
MKQHPKIRMALIVAAGLVSFVPWAVSAEAQATSSRVEVSFNHPEQFADIRDRYLATEENKKEVLSTLQEYVVQRASSYLPKGESLRITFDNIKLAGVINIAGVVGERRVILASTPPMFMFEWAVTDSSGKVIGSAKEKLEENNFKDLSSRADEGDPLRYERAVLDDWMRNRLES